MIAVCLLCAFTMSAFAQSPELVTAEGVRAKIAARVEGVREALKPIHAAEKAGQKPTQAEQSAVKAASDALNAAHVEAVALLDASMNVADIAAVAETLDKGTGSGGIFGPYQRHAALWHAARGRSSLFLVKRAQAQTLASTDRAALLWLYNVCVDTSGEANRDEFRTCLTAMQPLRSSKDVSDRWNVRIGYLAKRYPAEWRGDLVETLVDALPALEFCDTPLYPKGVDEEDATGLALLRWEVAKKRIAPERALDIYGDLILKLDAVKDSPEKQATIQRVYNSMSAVKLKISGQK